MYAGVDISSVLLKVVPFLVFLSAVGFALYVLYALGLYKMGKNLGINGSWLAFIPVANLYVMGKIVDQVSIGGLSVPRLEFVLPVGFLAAIILGQTPVIGPLVSVAFFVFYYIILYSLYNKYRPDSAMPFIIVSILLGFMVPVLLFIMRNDIHVERRVKLQS